jgi:molybdopterin converting factor small subunit
MPTVRLRAPLKKLAGDEADHELDGGTVLELLAELERSNPALAGWVLDERGALRRHINVFLDGERCAPDSPIGEGQVVEVIPAISGGR